MQNSRVFEQWGVIDPIPLVVIMAEMTHYVLIVGKQRVRVDCTQDRLGLQHQGDKDAASR